MAEETTVWTFVAADEVSPGLEFLVVVTLETAAGVGLGLLLHGG
jgi:hypothetical protein